jgi:hypothetical protein
LNRRWKIAVFAALALTWAASPADADPTEQNVGETVDALPGVIRVGAATELNTGGALAGFAGYGYTGEVLGTGDAHHRIIGDFSASYRPLSWLGVGLRLDGRYDRHVSVSNGRDDGWVGDPRLIARAVKRLGDYGVGGGLTLWFPGSNAPSLIPSATTVDMILLGSWLPAGKRYTASANLGFRLDQSAKSVDNAMLLSLADRMALGVSDSNAFLAGVGGTYRVGPIEALAEWSWDLLVGRNAPAMVSSPMRVTTGGRYHISEAWMAQAHFDLNLARSPVVDATSALVPIEPRYRILLGVHYQFGHSRPQEQRSLTEVAEKTEKPKPARLTGHVIWGGVGVAGATVEVALTGAAHPFSGSTDESGKFEIGDLPAGAATVTVRAQGFKSKQTAKTLVVGGTVTVEVALEKELPPGQLRGVVRSLRGAKLAGATLSVQPGGVSAVTNSSGYFEIVLQPGDYQVEVIAAGHEEQRPTVHIEQNGVTIYNFDLTPKK